MLLTCINEFFALCRFASGTSDQENLPDVYLSTELWQVIIKKVSTVVIKFSDFWWWLLIVISRFRFFTFQFSNHRLQIIKFHVWTRKHEWCYWNTIDSIIQARWLEQPSLSTSWLACNRYQTHWANSSSPKSVMWKTSFITFILPFYGKVLKTVYEWTITAVDADACVKLWRRLFQNETLHIFP